MVLSQKYATGTQVKTLPKTVEMLYAAMMTSRVQHTRLMVEPMRNRRNWHRMEHLMRVRSRQ
jgi:hypothetical protein